MSETQYESPGLTDLTDAEDGSDPLRGLIGTTRMSRSDDERIAAPLSLVQSENDPQTTELLASDGATEAPTDEPVEESEISLSDGQENDPETDETTAPTNQNDDAEDHEPLLLVQSNSGARSRSAPETSKSTETTESDVATVQLVSASEEDADQTGSTGVQFSMAESENDLTTASLAEPEAAATGTVFVVTTLADELDSIDPSATIASMGGAADLSLREAIFLANNNGIADDLIIFAGDASDTSGLTLLDAMGNPVVGTSGEIFIGAIGADFDFFESLTIDGDRNDDGVADISISADSSEGANDASSRIFDIANDTGPIVFDGLIIRDGNLTGATDVGAGIFVGINSSLTIYNSQIIDNSAVSNGGGIYANRGSTVKIYDSTISGNSADFGGGIYASGNLISSVTLRLEDVTISGNSAVELGGGVYTAENTVADVIDSTISDNSASYSGGGFYLFYTNATFMGSTITGNSAAYDGGGISSLYSNVTITGSTIFGNTAGYDGGGIYFDSFGTPLNLVNSTVSANTAGRYGGGVATRYETDNYQAVNVFNSTISGNIVGVDGGGIYLGDKTDLTISNSIVLGNSVGGSSDEIFVGGGVDAYGYGGDASQTISGTSIIGTLLYAPGGSSQDVINNSSTIADVAQLVFFDTVNFVDLNGDGVMQGGEALLGANILAGQLDANGGPVLTIRLDDAAGNAALDAGEASQLDENIVGVDLNGDGTIDMTAGQDLLFDARGALRSADLVSVGNTSPDTVDLGAIELQFRPGDPIPARTYVVTTLDDELDGTSIFDVTAEQMGGTDDLSLREAIFLANLDPNSADTITFDPGLNGLLRLTMDEIEITGELTIDGGGAITITGDADDDDVTVNGDITDVGASGAGLLDDNSRIFNVTSGSAPMTIDELTLTGGRSVGDYSGGGAILSMSDLTLMNSTVSGNSTTGLYSFGGGLAVYATLTVTDSVISTNVTTGNEASGGGIAASTLLLSNSTVSNNRTEGDYAAGGGITGSNVTVENALITGNTTAGLESYGGGIYSDQNAYVTDSTISGNATYGALASGGGAAAYGMLEVTGSTITGNSTSNYDASGGGLASGSLLLVNSTVSDNSSSGNLAVGGGITANNATLVNATVSGNSTIGSGAHGGAIYTDQTAELINSTVSGNSTAGSGALGGGIYSYGAGGQGITLTNSIVSGNVSSFSGVDGDELYQSTNYGASVSYTGGNIVGDTFTVDGGSAVSGITASDIFDQTAEAIDGDGVATGVYAGVLDDNGGPVQTIGLLADLANPALDTGTGALPTETDLGVDVDGDGLIEATPISVDARLFDRDVDIPGVGSTPDLGAFETQTITTPGPDILIGTAGVDTLFGGDGNDLLIGGGGADEIDGGDGIDTVDYSLAPTTAPPSGSGLQAFLDGTAGFGGEADGDVLVNVENLIGSDFNDALGGDGGMNTLSGGDGFDTLIGADGGVQDVLDGGAQIDIAFYFSAGEGQVVDLFDHTDPMTNSGEHMADIWISIEGVFGAFFFSNHLTGNDDANYLIGGNLQDTISGSGGDDQLSGLGGNDVLEGGAGIDALAGGAGTDTLTGGADTDIVYVQTGNEIDIVTDWVEAEDLFLFFQTGAQSFADLTFTDTTPGAGGNVEITSALDTSFTIIVENVEITDLDEADRYIFF